MPLTGGTLADHLAIRGDEIPLDAIDLPPLLAFEVDP
jgi:hypothetical protein